MTDPADLSDAELCEAVAREVLEWRAVRQWPPDESAFGYAEGDYGFKSSLEMDWSGIGQVVEAMQERHGHTLIYQGRNDVALFIDEHMVARGSVKNQDPARAVFEAALKTVRAEGGDEA